MHVLVVTDQHPESLGGVQVVIRQQRRELERLGHRVTVVAPALHRPGYVPRDADREAYIDLPSRPITRDREYGMSWPGARIDRIVAAALRQLPRVDVVHIQGDFWGALIGQRVARGIGAPVVLTMHNNVDEGTRAVTPLAPVVFWGLKVWRWLALGRPRGSVSKRARGAWRYLAQLAADAQVVTAPSHHFADTLVERGVAGEVAVTPAGVDDEMVERVCARSRPVRERPRFVWLGRMSAEKRVLELIEAIHMAKRRYGVNAEYVLHGAGLLLSEVEVRVAQLDLGGDVRLAGPVPHEAALEAIHDADALVQTSIGFETQGLTPFEAAALGTPTVFCDPLIAADVAVDPGWLAADESVDALAAALRDASQDLGTSARVKAGGRFLQSAQTERLLALYEGLY